MTFLFNSEGSRQWLELTADELESLLKPLAGLDGHAQRWIAEAEHGQVILMDGMRIVCVDLSEEDDGETQQPLTASGD